MILNAVTLDEGVMGVLIIPKLPSNPAGWYPIYTMGPHLDRRVRYGWQTSGRTTLFTVGITNLSSAPHTQLELGKQNNENLTAFLVKTSNHCSVPQKSILYGLSLILRSSTTLLSFSTSRKKSCGGHTRKKLDSTKLDWIVKPQIM